MWSSIKIWFLTLQIQNPKRKVMVCSRKARLKEMQMAEMMLL